MTIWKWLNNKRLRDYPRLVFISSYAVLFLNLLLHIDWIGGLTNYLMWGDFIIYYAAGKLYINDIQHLYDFTTQEAAQLSLIGSSGPTDISFYSYPPNAALFHSFFTLIPLPLALALWCVLSVISVIFSARLMKRNLAPSWLLHKGFSAFQLSILIFSSFAFIEGFEKGQSHALTLLLTVSILIATKREQWFLAGFLAAFSTYKPQFILGFIILWLLWGKYKAILSFIAFSGLWNGIVVLTKGYAPYLAFLDFSNQMIYLPYAPEGYPNFLMATPYTLIATILPFSLAPIWIIIFSLISTLLITFFAFLVFQTRKRPIHEQNISLGMAILLPLVAFPYALLHDLLILIPVILLLALNQEHEKELKSLAVIIYIGMITFPLLGYLGNVALTALIPIMVYIYCFQQALRFLRIKPLGHSQIR